MKLGNGWALRLAFEPRDWWVGLYWCVTPKAEDDSLYTLLRPRFLRFYLCLVPLLPIILEKRLSTD